MNIKINKKSRLLYILLACFLLFGFMFLPFQRSKVFADEVSPDNLNTNLANYIFDLDRVVLKTGSVYTSLDYPKPIYHDKLQYYYDNNISSYYNRRVCGFVVNNSEVEQNPSFDIMFGAGVDNVQSVMNYNLTRDRFDKYFSVPLYKSNSYIPLSHSTASSLTCYFNDSFISLTNYFYNGELDYTLFRDRGFNLYFIGNPNFVATINVSYRLYYNLDVIPSSRVNGGVSVSPSAKLNLSDVFTYTKTFTANSDGVAGGLVYSPGYDTQFLGNNLSLAADFGTYYKYITDFTINCTFSSSVRQVSFTNYSYETSPEHVLNFVSVVGNDLTVDEFQEFDLGSFLFNSVSGFFSFQLLPGLSLGALLGVVVAIPLAIMILKFFAGG